MRSRISTWVLFGVALAATAGGLAAEPSLLGLSVGGDGQLLLRGQPFRGIGVNYFDAFLRTLYSAADRSYDEGFATLARYQIPFARFMGCGYWPSEMKRYLSDRQSYFERLDRVVRSAEKHGIGLIPSLFWHPATIPDLVDEPCDQWGNPASKTHELMRRYTRDVVTRYAGSPAIWGWEFGNEYNLGADLPNAASHRPPIVPQLGTPTERTRRDEWSHDMIRVAFAEFAREVRKHDPQRIISAGNSIPRPCAWHMRREKSWGADTPEQFAEMLAGDSPDPYSVVSIHAYGDDVPRIAAAARVARLLKKPLFVGEFGIPGPRTAESEKQFAEVLRILEEANVPLASVWVFDHGPKDPCTVTAANDRRYQLEAIARANQRWVARP